MVEPTYQASVAIPSQRQIESTAGSADKSALLRPLLAMLQQQQQQKQQEKQQHQNEPQPRLTPKYPVAPSQQPPKESQLVSFLRQQKDNRSQKRKPAPIASHATPLASLSPPHLKSEAAGSDLARTLIFASQRSEPLRQPERSQALSESGTMTTIEKLALLAATTESNRSSTVANPSKAELIALLHAKEQELARIHQVLHTRSSLPDPLAQRDVNHAALVPQRYGPESNTSSEMNLLELLPVAQRLSLLQSIQNERQDGHDQVLDVLRQSNHVANRQPPHSPPLSSTYRNVGNHSADDPLGLLLQALTARLGQRQHPEYER